MTDRLSSYPHAKDCTGRCLWCNIAATVRVQYGQVGAALLEEVSELAKRAPIFMGSIRANCMNCGGEITTDRDGAIRHECPPPEKPVTFTVPMPQSRTVACAGCGADLSSHSITASAHVCRPAAPVESHLG